jgi:hypothetical protein
MFTQPLYKVVNVFVGVKYIFHDDSLHCRCGLLRPSSNSGGATYCVTTSPLPAVGREQ